LSASGKAVRVIVIICLIMILFYVAVPKALGMASPRALSRSTRPVRIIQPDIDLPGDHTEHVIVFSNDQEFPVDYQVVFAPSGEFWRCDHNGSDPYYDFLWNPGSDQHLEPGETETITITVSLPQSAGNACQNKEGALTVRRSTQSTQHIGVYDCRPTFFSRLFGRNQPANSLRGHICTRAGWPLYTLLNR
jgi:hypothetical protein